MRRFLLTLILLGTFAMPAHAHTDGPEDVTMSSSRYHLEWNTVGGISGATSVSPRFKLDGTLGQMTARTLASSNRYQLCLGQQCVHFQNRVYRIYLPIVFMRF